MVAAVTKVGEAHFGVERERRTCEAVEKVASSPAILIDLHVTVGTCCGVRLVIIHLFILHLREGIIIVIAIHEDTASLDPHSFAFSRCFSCSHCLLIHQLLT